MYNTSLIINITWRQKKTSQRCLSITLVAASVSVCYYFPGKDPITQRCKMTLGKTISAHGQRLLSYINASEFGVHRFPTAWKPNSAALYAAGPWNPINRIPKGTCQLLYKWHSCRRAVDGKVVSNNCACCYRQTVLLHPENVSRPSAR